MSCQVNGCASPARYVRTSLCQNHYNLAWREANLEKARAIGRRSYHKHRQANLERARIHREANRDRLNELKRARYAALTPDERWDIKLRKTYRISADDYNAMLEQQHGVCAICHLPERPGRDGRLVRLSVDHNHKTGAVRSLLCRACNTCVGMVEDEDRTRRFHRYLEGHGHHWSSEKAG